MDPALLQAAELMATHYINTRYQIRLARIRKGETKKAPYRTWATTDKDEKQELIQAFAVILQMAGDEELKAATTPNNLLNR